MDNFNANLAFQSLSNNDHQSNRLLLHAFQVLSEKISALFLRKLSLISLLALCCLIERVYGKLY